ncbi:hypothetical protein ACJX0J_010294, partial [Zea mays]
GSSFSLVFIQLYIEKIISRHNKKIFFTLYLHLLSLSGHNIDFFDSIQNSKITH